MANDFQTQIKSLFPVSFTVAIAIFQFIRNFYGSVLKISQLFHDSSIYTFKHFLSSSNVLRMHIRGR